MANRLKNSEEYLSFRSSVPKRKIAIDNDLSKAWKLYDAGPRNITCPLICLPPSCGNADVFFRQIMSLSSLGYRVIAVDYPPYWNVDQFCVGFRKLIDELNLTEVHLFGCSLGGFLAQKFAERTSVKKYVSSLVLCNTFTDTSVFKMQRASAGLWTLPSFILKKFVLGKLSSGYVDTEQADGLDFIVDCLDSLTQKELSSRLRLQYCGEYVRYPQLMQEMPITLLDVFDDVTISQIVKEHTYKCFPFAKVAYLKSGGDFPYLSRSSEVNLHLRIHLRNIKDEHSEN